MMFGLSRYVASAFALVAAGAVLWAIHQERRADELANQLDQARTQISRLEAEAKAREVVSHAIDQVQRLDDLGVVEWLRARAGRN